MRMSMKPAAALAGTAALVAGVALWPSVAGADSGKDKSGKVIEGEFTSIRLDDAFIDNDGNQALSFGDGYAYTSSVSSVVGDATEYGTCTFHQVPETPTAGTVILACVQTGDGEDGSLSFQGTYPFNLATGHLAEPVDWAITGGTGKFARARGEIRLVRTELVDDDVDDDDPGVFTTFGTMRVILSP